MQLFTKESDELAAKFRLWAFSQTEIAAMVVQEV